MRKYSISSRRNVKIRKQNTSIEIKAYKTAQHIKCFKRHFIVLVYSSEEQPMEAGTLLLYSVSVTLMPTVVLVLARAVV